MTGGRNPMRWVQAEVRRICRAAGLPDDITFTSFRHGGHTDGADAGLTDAQMRAVRSQKYGGTPLVREGNRRTT